MTWRSDIGLPWAFLHHDRPLWMDDLRSTRRLGALVASGAYFTRVM